MTTYNSLVLGGAPGSWDTTVDLWDSATLVWDRTGVTSITEVRQVDLIRSISDNNATSRLEFDVPNWAGYKKDDFPAANEITLYADLNVNPPVTKVFGGVITEVKFTGTGSNKEAIHITCRDFTSLLQKNTIDPEIYINQEISLIVINLMQKYAPLAFTTTGVQTTGVTLTRQTFKRINLFDALKQLADLAGNWFFYVDENKDLKFAPKNTVASGLTFDNTNTTKTEFKTDIESVKNRVYVYGSRQIVTQPTQNFTADGVGSVFTLQYSPSNTKVAVSGVQKKGDILNNTQNPTSGPDFLVDYNAKNIVFVSGTAYGYSSIPGSLVNVAVDYGVSRPIVKLAEDFTSIYAYGKRTMEVIDENISDPQMAVNIAKTQLAMNKDPKQQGQLTVRGVVACVPGQTCVVDFPYEGQSSVTANILEAKYSFNKINNFSDQVLTVKVASRIADVTDVLKNLLLSVQRLQASQVDTAGILTRLIGGTGSVGVLVPSWSAKTRYINDTFILGHPINGVMGLVAGRSMIGSLTGDAYWDSGLTNTGYNKAVHFVGSTAVPSRVEMNNFSGLLGLSGEFTVSLWTRLDSLTPSSTNSGTSLFFNLAGQGLYPRMQFSYTGNQSMNIRVNNITKIINGATVVAGSLYHIVAQYAPLAGSAFIWNNGVQVGASNVGPGSLTYGATQVMYLGHDTNTTGYCSGIIDDFRVYNRMLSSGEIANLYAGSNVTGGLVGYYKLDEGVGSYAYSSTSGTDYKLQPILGDRRTVLTTIQSGAT